MDSICLIAAPRTGTNHLCAVLENFDDLASFVGAFDPEAIRGTDPATWPLLRQATGVEFMNGRDLRLTTYARANPGRWLDALEQAALFKHKRFMSFRLFRGDLEIEAIEREVLPRPGLRAIMVVRRQIDTYVSWRKSIELGKTQGVDTTGMRLVLDPDRFEDWLTQQERWYGHWKDALARRFLPCPVLRYETDIDQPPDRLLRRFAAAAAQVGVMLRVPATVTHPGLTKQDRSSAIGDKVTNWPAFSREIFQRGLERRAFGYPL